MITIPGLRIMYLRLFQLETGVFAVADPGEGHGRPAPPPPPPTYFSTKMRPKGPKHSFLETAPAPCLRVWMTGPLPTPRPYLEVCTRHLFGLRKFFSVKSLDQFKKTICNVTI